MEGSVVVFTFVVCLLSSEKIREEPDSPVIVTMGDKLEKLCLTLEWEVLRVLLPTCSLVLDGQVQLPESMGFGCLFSEVEWVFLHQQGALVRSLLCQLLC